MFRVFPNIDEASATMTIIILHSEFKLSETFRLGLTVFYAMFLTFMHLLSAKLWKFYHNNKGLPRAWAPNVRPYAPDAHAVPLLVRFS